ncbi:DUF3226 domain-containing protein [Tissierella pigra]|uniref:Uncharacterized protein n=1 Tax=Tissierella pigra TaxID=2607614 RepID=A0A6N7XHD7_9FIRM|nr:DUF3226 domain-containing protein [Tissierella pigra]MSU00132.1 hypothetical protein [Tissierella pigra]
MKSLILCEGFDDMYILGYYLHKTDEWNRKNDIKISQLYDFPKVHFRNQGIEVYERGDEILAIWCVGGKDSFEESFKFLKRINENHPEEGFEKMFILTDRDDLEIKECLKVIEYQMQKCGLIIKDLENNHCNRLEYEVENEIYKLDIMPVIIPFDQTGALENVLIEAIRCTCEEDKLIVEKAEEYVDKLAESDIIDSYLKNPRQVLKSKFSSVISITNPDRSTALFNSLLMTHPWEEKQEIVKHFKIFNEVLNKISKTYME